MPKIHHYSRWGRPASSCGWRPHPPGCTLLIGPRNSDERCFALSKVQPCVRARHEMPSVEHAAGVQKQPTDDKTRQCLFI
jgi:hypothetical protein